MPLRPILGQAKLDGCRRGNESLKSDHKTKLSSDNISPPLPPRARKSNNSFHYGWFGPPAQSARRKSKPEGGEEHEIQYGIYGEYGREQQPREEGRSERNKEKK